MTDRGRRPLHPAVRVQNRVLSKGCRLTATQRFVALAVAARFDATGFAFMSNRDIQERTGYGRRAVQRAVAAICDGPTPLFARQLPGPRRAYEFRLVTNPAAFAKARDETRASQGHPKTRTDSTKGVPRAPRGVARTP